MFKFRKSINSEFSSPAKTAIENKILSKSLMWFGGAITFVLVFAFLFLKVSVIRFELSLFFLSIFGRLGIAGSIIFAIIAFVLHYFCYSTISRGSTKINFGLLFLMFAFIVFMDMWLVVFSFIYVNAAQGLEGVLIMVAIPMFATLVLGVVGYTGFINFNNLRGVMLFLFVALIISSIVGFFIMNSFLNTLISAIALAFYFLYMGYIFYTIKHQEEYLGGIPTDYWPRAKDWDSDEKKVVNAVINRAALAYGMLLFMAFVRIIYYLARIMGRD